MPTDKPRKDCWDKIQIVAALLIPLTIAFAGWWIERSFKNEDVELAYITIAIDILRDKPNADNKPDALRDWAVTVVTEFSIVPFSTDAKKQLTNDGFPYAFNPDGSFMLKSDGTPAKKSLK